MVVETPEAGKTLMVRDVACFLSETLCFMISDLSCKIGVPDVVPHESVGKPRRMSILIDKRRLEIVVIETVENLTSDVIFANDLSNCNRVICIIIAG